jgi:hypothetical protein
MNLPTSGTAWDKMRTTAYGSWGTADLKNQDNKHAIYTLAGALVYARIGDPALRSKVRNSIIAAKQSLDESADWRQGVRSVHTSSPPISSTLRVTMWRLIMSSERGWVQSEQPILERMVAGQTSGIHVKMRPGIGMHLPVPAGLLLAFTWVIMPMFNDPH